MGDPASVVGDNTAESAKKADSRPWARPRGTRANLGIRTLPPPTEAIRIVCAVWGLVSRPSRIQRYALGRGPHRRIAGDSEPSAPRGRIVVRTSVLGGILGIPIWLDLQTPDVRRPTRLSLKRARTDQEDRETRGSGTIPHQSQA